VGQALADGEYLEGTERKVNQNRLHAGLLFCDPIGQTFDKIAL
jgi:hypothetical protein